MKIPQDRVIRLIALFKMLKALTLIAVGAAALKLIHADAAGTLDHWVTRLSLNAESPFFDQAVTKLGSLSPNQMKDAGLVAFVYAALFLTEGTGLWLKKRWAEWLTTIITASLLPLEIYEIHRHPSVAKVLVFLINLAIVVYLLVQLRKKALPDQRSSPPLETRVL